MFAVIAAVACGAIAPSPYLPALLQFDNGTIVDEAAWFASRRPQISSLLQTTIVGTVPSVPPKLTKSRIVNHTVAVDGYSASSTFVEVTFDAVGTEVSFFLEVLRPTNTSEKHPLFLTQWNHREWALIGVSRGYVCVVYPGADTRDVAPVFQAVYNHTSPSYSMRLIVARAFVASRAIDYAQDLPYVNSKQICITGHSRNGKQSLLAAAFDSRITAVVGSSPGAPISSPYRFSTSNFYGEGPQYSLKAKWWLPSIMQYNTHPENMPIDGHAVLAMIAPRAAAVAHGWTDHEGDLVFSDEMNVKAAGEVYALLGAPSALRCIDRPGDHHGYDDVHSYFDWFDHTFGRLNAAFPLAYTAAFAPSFLTPAGFSWAVWQNAFAGSCPPPPPLTSPMRSRIGWLLQTPLGGGSAQYEPAFRSVGSTYAEQSADFDYITEMMHRKAEESEQFRLKRKAVSFGDYVTGNVFWPENLNSTTGAAAVIWLHPYSYATGYTPAYGQANVFEDLAAAGFVVLAYDQIGFATRIREGGTTFYSRYGGASSLFGHMVKDAHSAVDFLLCRTAAGRTSAACGTGETYTGPYTSGLNDIPAIDPSQVYLAGYSLGGNVALHTAALDSRVAGVAAFASFTPFRTDTAEKSTGGTRRLFDLHALLPRLGLFQRSGNGAMESSPYLQSEIPYDYDELLASIAPRKVLLYTPQGDRDATYKDVQDAIKNASAAWKSKSKLTVETPDDHSRMEGTQVSSLVKWLKMAVSD